MKLLLDQDVYSVSRIFLRELGPDAVPVAHLGLSKAYDSDLLKKAQEEDRIFVARDRDFGSLVFVSGLGAGVIYLRLLPSTRHAVHEELERVLSTHTENELKKAFVVVEPGRHRFRKVLD